MRPGQKLAAVRALQAAGHVVAMVGDGVNDIQALKQADLGIAMGSGSQASRSVARIVLLDSSFAAIPQVLGEGKRVIANIERVASLFVTKTVYAAIIAVAVALSGLPFPFFPRHLTIISTLTIGIPGFFLALAAGAPRGRPGFIRRVLAFTVPAGLAAAAATVACYVIARSVLGANAVQSRTAALLALFAMGMWVLALIAKPLTAARTGLLGGLAAGLWACCSPSRPPGVSSPCIYRRPQSGWRCSAPSSSRSWRSPSGGAFRLIRLADSPGRPDFRPLLIAVWLANAEEASNRRDHWEIAAVADPAQ